MAKRCQVFAMGFLIVPIMVASSPTPREKLELSPMASAQVLKYELDQKVDLRLNEVGNRSTKSIGIQPFAVHPPPLPEPEPELNRNELSEADILEKNGTQPAQFHRPTPAESISSMATTLPCGSQSSVHTPASLHASNRPGLGDGTPANESTEPSALANLEFPLPSLLPLITATPAAQMDVDTVLAVQLSNTLVASLASLTSRKSFIKGGTGRREFSSRPDGKALGRLCSGCNNRPDCSADFVCRKGFCVENQRQLEQCERRVQCAPCGKGLPRCARLARCVRGICVGEGQSRDACRRVRGRAIQRVYKKKNIRSYQGQIQKSAANLCDPCLRPLHCQGGRICSPGKPCRSLNCRAGFCSFSVRMSVRLCSKIYEF